MLRPRLPSLLPALLLCLLPVSRACAEVPAVLVRDAWRLDVVLNADLTFTETIAQDYDFPEQAGIALADRDELSFHPGSQTLELVEAETREPDGAVLPVPDSAVFTRPAQAEQDAPGFSGATTTTVLFPRLTAGSHTHVKWRLTQTRPAPLGFNILVRPVLNWPTRTMTVVLHVPPGVPLDWRARGFLGAETVAADGARTITARLDDLPGEAPERNMVAASDFQPVFVASTLGGAAALGAAYHRGARDASAVTPEIAALAARVAGSREGPDAARAIHDWVARNIRYVAVFLDPSDAWAPHPASEVLARGYGDCKDHVALLQALLAARGIRAQAALIDWGARYAPFPLTVPQQFNHVIAWLPDYDLYANPTNPYATLGALDRRLSGKMTVIASEAGEVRRTPDSRPQDNRYRLDAEIDIAEDGTVTGDARYAMDAPIEAGAREDLASAATWRELAERMLSATPEGGSGELSAADPRDVQAPLDLAAHWSSPHGVPIDDGVGYFTTPVGIDFEQSSAILRPYLGDDAPRRHALLAGAEDLDWHYVIHLPPGFALARIPAAVALHNGAGAYVARYERVPGGVDVARSLVIARDVFPPEAADDLRRLFFAALDDARATMVMTRAQSAAR